MSSTENGKVPIDHLYHSPSPRENQLHLQQSSTTTAFLTSVDPIFSSVLQEDIQGAMESLSEMLFGNLFFNTSYVLYEQSSSILKLSSGI